MQTGRDVQDVPVAGQTRKSARVEHAIRFALYQSGPICIVITTVAVWPVLGRLLSPAQVGDLSLLLAVTSLLSPVMCLGGHLYLANRLASATLSDRLPEVLTAAVLVFGLYGVALLAAGSALLVSVPVVQVSVALASANAAYMVASGVMRGVNRPWQFAVISFWIQVLGLAVLGFASKLQGDLGFGVLVYVGLVSLPVLMQWNVLRRHIKRFPLRAVLDVLRLSSQLVPHLVLAVALLMAMRILVSALLGNEEVAYYTFAALIIGGSLTIASSLDAHWSVRAQRSTSVESMGAILQQNQMRSQALLLVASIFIAAFLICLLEIWLPADYDDRAVTLAVILGLPAASMQSAADGRSALLVWLGKPGTVSFSTALGTFATLGLAYVLLPDYGWPVAGFCITVGTSIRMFCSIFLAKRAHARSTVGFRVLVMVSVQVSLAATLLVFFVSGVI